MLLHQQMYVDWVYRAYRHGLRLMVMTITHSRTLCESFHRSPGAPCSDEAVIAAQIDATRRMLDAIAEREGGWMRLARSAQRGGRDHPGEPAGARARYRGRHAVRLRRRGRRALQHPTRTRPALDWLYGAGVRQITPIHLIDNGFGGAAIFDDHMNVNQLYLRDTLLEPDPAGCKDERVDFEFTGGSASLVRRW